MTKTLKDLWNGNICPAENLGAGNYKMRSLEHRLFESEEKISQALSEDLKTFFQNYLDFINEYISLSNEEAFGIGFSYGVKLISESITK